MSDEINFADLAELNTSSDESKPPANFPPGKYASVVRGTPRTREVKWNDKETGEPKSVNVLSFYFVPTEDLEGVNQDELESRNIEFGKRGIKHDYWLDSDSLWRLNKLYEACGLDTEGRSHVELIEEVVGSELGIIVTEEPAKKDSDGTLYNRIKAVVNLS